MRTPEHVWLVVEHDRVVKGEMPSGDPSVYSVPVGLTAGEALEQMARDGWQPLGDEAAKKPDSYRIHLVRDNPPE
jgi:hypothetical protein